MVMSSTLLPDLYLFSEFSSEVDLWILGIRVGSAGFRKTTDNSVHCFVGLGSGHGKNHRKLFTGHYILYTLI